MEKNANWTRAPVYGAPPEIKAAPKPTSSPLALHLTQAAVNILVDPEHMDVTWGLHLRP